MASSQNVQVLRELDGGWLQVQDAQGVFFFNKVTQQSSDSVPAQLQAMHQAPQLATTAAPAPQVQVLSKLGAGWLQCQDNQGVFFFNEVTRETSVDVPAALRAPAAFQPQSTPQVQPPGFASFQPQVMPQVQQTQAQQLAPSSNPRLKEQIGEWMICEDEQGEYYVNSRTQQSFSQPPQELVQQYQLAQQQKQLAAQQAAAHQAAVQQQQQMQLQQGAMHYQQAPPNQYMNYRQ